MKKNLLKLCLFGTLAITLLHGKPSPVQASSEDSFITEDASVKASTPIRTSDHTSTPSGYGMVGLRGEFFRSDASQALARINAIRKEACVNGYRDPRNTSRKLTASDYVPLTWSNALEWIAQTRAAEASWLQSHSRPDGSYWISCTNQGKYSEAECLAWYTANQSSVTQVKGVELWYSEKSIYLSNPNDSAAGHYRALINPEYKSIALGCFVSDAYKPYGYLWPCVSAEFSRTKDSSSSAVAVSGQYVQTIPIALSDISLSLKAPSLIETGTKGSMTLTAYSTVPADTSKIYRWTVLNNISWKQSNKQIATVNSSGKVTGVGEGTCAIYAYMGTKKAATKVYVSSAPKLLGIYNSTRGIGIKFKPSSTADKYAIYQKKDGSWVKITTVAATSASLTTAGSGVMYIDTTVRNNYGKGYIYSVSALRGSSETSYDKTGLAIYRLKPPTIQSVTSAGSGKVTVKWSSVDCLGYELSYSVKGSDKWTACPKTTSLSKTISGLSKNKTYIFRIRCYKTNAARGTFYSSYGNFYTFTVK